MYIHRLSNTIEANIHKPNISNDAYLVSLSNKYVNVNGRTSVINTKFELIFHYLIL